MEPTLSAGDAEHHLSHFPLFSHCDPIDLARALPFVEELRFDAEQTLFARGDEARYAYLLREGHVELRSDKRVTDRIGNGFLGEEAGLGDRYRCDAVATVESVLLRIPGAVLQGLMERTPALREGLLSSFINHYVSGGEIHDPPVPESDNHRPVNLRELIGWPLAAILPLVIMAFGEGWGFDWNAKTYLAIFAITFTLWVFRITHESVPALFAVVSLTVLGVVPKSVVLSGFTSGSFFMALSIFGLGAVLVASGLTYRLVLLALRRLPETQAGYWFGSMMLGLFMTPVLPSANGRVTLIAPLFTDTKSSLGYRDGDRAATRLAATAFTGITLFSPLFLTAKSANLVVYGLLPAQIQTAFHWSYWVFASLVAGFVLFTGSALMAKLFFRSDERPKLSRQCIESQLSILGPLRGNEWAAIVGIGALSMGILTKSLHKIDPAWVALIVLYSLLTVGAMTQRQFRDKIDWSFLFVLAGMIGLIQTMSHVGLDLWIAKQLMWLEPYMRTDFELFVLLLSGAVLALRVLVPLNSVIVLFATIFIPMADSVGVNPWVVGFIILMMSDAWALPYQSAPYGLFRRLANRDALYDHTALLKYNLGINLLRFAAVYASIPYWKALHLL